MEMIMKLDKRDILDNKYCVVFGRYPDEELSDIEVCFSILSDDKDTFLAFAELYRGFILGDHKINPIDTVAKRINIYN